jgi:site-specific DNA-cytosine methylase
LTKLKMPGLTAGFEWPKKTLRCLAKELGPETLKKSVLVQGSSLSTYFSGIGTPELALEILQAAKVKHLGVGNFEAVSACDWDSKCRNVLISQGNDLVFGDILERLPAEVRNGAALKGESFERKHQAIMSCSTKNPATSYSKDKDGKIVTTKSMCPPAVVDMSGSPCTDWSIIGAMKGCSGPTIPIFLTWARIQLENDTAVIIHENVRRFPSDQLKKVLGHKYHMYSIETEPADVGFGLLRRPRRYDVLIHKKKAQLLADIPETYAALQKAVGEHGDAGRRPWKRLDSFVHAYGASKNKELLDEERHIAEQRGKRCKDTAKNGAKSVDWFYLLLEREQKAVRDSTRMWKEKYPDQKDPSEDPSCIFHIGDNPLKRLVWSAGGTIPTFRRGGGFYWMPYYRRWILPKERLALMGFPVYPDLAKASGVPVMEIEDQRKAKMMAGNAMHLANAGAILAVTLACVQVVNDKDNKRKASSTYTTTSGQGDHAKRRRRD